MDSLETHLKDIVTSLIPGSLYYQISRKTQLLNNSELALRLKRGTLTFDVATYVLPALMELQSSSHWPTLLLYGFSGVLRSTCFKFSKSLGMGNDGRDRNSDDSPGTPPFPEAPSIENRATNYYWDSVERNRDKVKI